LGQRKKNTIFQNKNMGFKITEVTKVKKSLSFEYSWKIYLLWLAVAERS